MVSSEAFVEVVAVVGGADAATVAREPAEEHGPHHVGVLAAMLIHGCAPRCLVDGLVAARLLVSGGGATEEEQDDE
jgi:hypothetical protein